MLNDIPPPKDVARLERFASASLSINERAICPLLLELLWRESCAPEMAVPPKYALPPTENAVVEAYGKVFAAVAVEVMAPANVEAVVEVEVNDEPIIRLPKMSPATESFWPGVVVPIPTLPAAVIRMRSAGAAPLEVLKVSAWPVLPSVLSDVIEL